MRKPWIVFVLTMLTFVVYHFTVVNPPFDKQALKAQFYEPDFVMRDTAFYYELYADSLVLTLENDSHYNNWNFDLFFLNTTNHQEERLNRSYSGIPVVNNKLILKGFHLPSDSLSYFVPCLFGFPIIEDGTFVTPVPFDVSGIDFRRNGGKNRLIPYYRKKKPKYGRFHMEILDGLSEEKQEYCNELLFDALGMDRETTEQLLIKN